MNFYDWCIDNNKEYLISEWNDEKNLPLKINEIPFNLNKKVYWTCSNCNNEWETWIYSRRKGHNCPKCASKKIGEINSIPKNKNLKTQFPEICKEWDYEKNYPLKPEDVSCQSNKKVWWICSNCGKEWQTSIDTRYNSKKINCKSCNLKKIDRKAITGENDLETLYPKIAKEWDYEKNYPTLPNEVLAHSSKSYYWKCAKGHTWSKAVLSRTKDDGRGCPYCANRKVLIGYNDLATVSPELVKEWNYEKNKDLKPENVVAGSNTKVWWICSKGHDWKTSPNERTSANHNCPYCANQKVWTGYNDLATANPELTKEWDYKKNYPLKPTDVISGSDRKVWWICNNGHSFYSSIVNRNNGRNCPYCSNKKVLIGYNDLATVNPELAKEWNYEKNYPLKPTEVISGSTKKVWWKCIRGHEWKAYIVSRNQNHNCPICDSNKHTSLAEKSIVYYLRKTNLEVLENKKFENKEIDIFIPSLNIGIEYDGEYFHTSKVKDLSKNKVFNKLGITLIRIREPNLENLNSTSIDYHIEQLSSNHSYMNKVIKWIFNYLNVDCPDIDVERDKAEIYKLFQLGEETESIKITNPELLEEWNYSKNRDLEPSQVSKGQHIKVWWKCKKCNYEWSAYVYSRCCGSGCPKCANRENAKKPSKLEQGINDLQTLNPILAKEWNYEKNNISPSEVTTGSNKKVWWKCENGHSYPSTISNRIKGTGCPYCSNRKILVGYNDFGTTRPDLANEWNYEKNYPLKPSDVFANAKKKVWWTCSKCGYEWESYLYSRKEIGCKHCKRRK